LAGIQPCGSPLSFRCGHCCRLGIIPAVFNAARTEIRPRFEPNRKIKCRFCGAFVASGNFCRLPSLPPRIILNTNLEKPKRQSGSIAQEELARRGIPVVAYGLVDERGERCFGSASLLRERNVEIRSKSSNGVSGIMITKLGNILSQVRPVSRDAPPSNVPKWQVVSPSTKRPGKSTFRAFLVSECR
jgi:hypothetical protein